MSDFPRRIQMQQWVAAEQMIQKAVDDVEGMGADERLTDAVVLLGAARDRVADFVDGVPGKRTVPGFPAEVAALTEERDAALAREARLREALTTIAEYQAESPIDEWAEAEAFIQVQHLAVVALAGAATP